jgi:glycosyltransferase involved in cell wall biosynthesis
MSIAGSRIAAPDAPPEQTSAEPGALRVLHVHSGNLWGGVETVLVAMAAERDRCPGLLPEYALCFDGALRRRLGSRGVPLHDLGEVRWRSPLRVRRARRSLDALLRASSYDAVVTHSMWGHSLFASPIRRRSRLLVYWAHDFLDGTHWLQQWARRTPPDLVIANSAFTADGVSSVFPGVPTRVLHYPLSLAQSGQGARPIDVRAQLATPPDAVVLVQVSRLEAWKGHSILLEALRHLRDVPQWHCWIVGGAQRPAEHAYLAALQRQASEAGIGDRVRFLGHRDDVRDVLGAADIFCQPNASPEPFGIVLVEALAARLPVVAAASGGAREVVDRSCGELVAPGDATALAGVLRWLIADGGSRRALGAQGPARAAALCDPARQLRALATALASAQHV